ncbi:MAG: hypothetical protein HY264_09665 [Chloroflexi bacterium]|nr:hypothetical protein [Chloroflexota bacterium]
MSASRSRDPEVVVIGADPVAVEVLPGAGARLARLTAFGHDLMPPPPPVDARAGDPYGWGGYVMAPWCNRIAPGPTRVAGRTVDLVSNFSDGSAIHGQVATLPWQREADGLFVIRGGGSGWPWRYEVVERVSVSGARLRVELSLTNLAEDPMPAGIGLHPWFVAGLEIAVAGTRVAPNLDPAGRTEPVAGPHDLRRLGRLPDGLDATWLDVGRRAVELRWPALGLEATLELDSSGGRAVAVASPAGAGVAVEPQTHGPWALARLLRGDPDGLSLLSPGASLDLAIDLEIRRTA